MIFGNKNKDKCKNCNSGIDAKNFSFCPYCGYSLLSLEKEAKDFGFLGKHDFERKKAASAENNPNLNPNPFGINDNLINSIMQSVMKSLEKQMKEVEPQIQELEEANASIEHSPNGIKISIGMPAQRIQPKQKQISQKRQITEGQMDKLSKLPRQEAKSKLRRLNNKVVYEISAPGISAPEDVFISKLESGYEIKAIGKSKIYTNKIPISLPLKGFAFDDKNLFIEFKAQK